MFIPFWLLVITSIILAWSIWMNFDRSKQMSTLKYGFVTISDLAINRLREIKSERVEKEGDDELLPFVIVDSLTEVEAAVEHLLDSQQKAGVFPYTMKDGAKALGI
jgi:hypothetical protein